MTGAHVETPQGDLHVAGTAPVQQKVAPLPAPEMPAVEPGAARRVARFAHEPDLVLALCFVVILVFITLFAEFIAPYDPIAQDLANPLAGPSWSHLLGTDNLGRDVLSRLMWGARPALVGVAIALVTVCLIGIPWGLVAGYAGGVLDLLLMRIADALLVFPGLVLALVLTTVLGPSLKSTMVAMGIVYSPVLARIVRAGVLRVAPRDFVVVTRLYRLSAWHRMWQHVLPNALTPAIVQVTLLAGHFLLAQTGLSFLGLGIQPPFPSWGGSLSESFQYIAVHPSATFAPGIVVVLTVLSLYRIGDALRDWFGARAKV